MAIELTELPALRQLIRDEAGQLLLELGVIVPKEVPAQIEVKK